MHALQALRWLNSATMPKLQSKLSAFGKGRLGHRVGGPGREDVRKGLSYPLTSASTMLILGYLEVLGHQVVPLTGGSRWDGASLACRLSLASLRIPYRRTSPGRQHNGLLT